MALISSLQRADVGYPLRDAVAREVWRTCERRLMPGMTRWLLRKAGLPEPQPAF